MEWCVRQHRLRLLEWSNWRVGCTPLRWATGSRFERNPYRTARTLSLRGVRAVTFSPAFATRLAAAGRASVAKFLRQHAVILNIDKLIPFPDMLPEPSLMAHSDFFEHAPRCRVSCKVVRVNPVQMQRRKSKFDHGGSSLRGVSSAPEWHTDPVAEFRVPMRIGKRESYRATEFATGRDRNGKRDGTPPAEILMGLFKKAQGIALRVRVRDVQSGRGDFVGTGEMHHGGDIFALEGAKQQSGGAQFLRSGHENRGYLINRFLAECQWKDSDDGSQMRETIKIDTVALVAICMGQSWELAN